VAFAHHVLDRLDLDSRRAHVADDPGQSLVPLGAGVGADQQFLIGGVVGVRGPHLLSIDNDIVAVELAFRR
jgi:hypothetical protein